MTFLTPVLPLSIFFIDNDFSVYIYEAVKSNLILGMQVEINALYFLRYHNDEFGLPNLIDFTMANEIECSTLFQKKHEHNGVTMNSYTQDDVLLSIQSLTFFLI